MCSICHGAYGHRAGCPNAQPQAVGSCGCCGEPIYEGSAVYRLNGELYHDDCFAENAVQLLQQMGAEQIVAKEEDYDEY